MVDRIAVEYDDSALVALLQFHCTVARAGTSRSGRTMNSSGWQQPPLTREEKREMEEVGQDQTPIKHAVGNAGGGRRGGRGRRRPNTNQPHCRKSIMQGRKEEEVTEDTTPRSTIFQRSGTSNNP